MTLDDIMKHIPIKIEYSPMIHEQHDILAAIIMYKGETVGFALGEEDEIEENIIEELYVIFPNLDKMIKSKNGSLV